MAQYVITNQQSEIQFECSSATLRTLQNAKNLLMTKRGEVPYDRNRGFDNRLFSLPMRQFSEELMPELDRVMLWEPDVNVVDADYVQDENGKAVLTVTLEVTENT